MLIDLNSAKCISELSRGTKHPVIQHIFTQPSERQEASSMVTQAID